MDVQLLRPPNQKGPPAPQQGEGELPPVGGQPVYLHTALHYQEESASVLLRARILFPALQVDIQASGSQALQLVLGERLQHVHLSEGSGPTVPGTRCPFPSHPHRRLPSI